MSEKEELEREREKLSRLSQQAESSAGKLGLVGRNVGLDELKHINALLEEALAVLAKASG
jgi:hypothetical protein